MRILGKGILYLLLVTGSALFLIPLMWMISTSLKPIEQTMALPPTWIPYQYYTEIRGKPTPIILGESIGQPSSIIQESSTKRRRIVPNDLIENNAVVHIDAQGKKSLTPIEVIEAIPASPEQPWIRISLQRQGNEIEPADRDRILAVPADTIQKQREARWSNYPQAIAAMKEFPNYLKNTLLVCFLSVLGTVSSSALAAYGFSRIPWKGRNKIFILALATMMIPFPVVMVPIYSFFRMLGWIGTLYPLWVGTFLAPAFHVFLLRQFFMNIPKDLSDAARIDGCSEFRIFWQIVLPLCKPALMVVGLFQFLYSWNDFVGPLIYLTDQKDFTLALGLQFFQSQHGGTEWHYLMAASTMVVLPVIVLFFLAQKSFIEGISMTGIKG